MSSNNNNPSGFTDLNNQLNHNLELQSKNQTVQLTRVNNIGGFRGHSRSSNTRGATQNNLGLAGIPGTANSSKRQNNISNQNQTNNCFNIQLLQKKSAINQAKNLEYLPITTTSYTTTGKSVVKTSDTMKSGSEFKVGMNSVEQSQSIRYSSLITNQNSIGQNNGNFGISGSGLNGPTKTMSIEMKKSNDQNIRIFNGTSVLLENIKINQNGLNVKSKSKQKLMPKSIDSQSTTKQLTNGEALNPGVSLNPDVVSPSKALINNANMQLSQNPLSAINDQSKQNSQKESTLPNIGNNGSGKKSQNTYNSVNASMQTSNQNKPLSDNIRKLALAAKSGQMQLNNLPNENNIFLQYNSSNNLNQQPIIEPVQFTQLQNLHQNNISKNQSTLKNTTKPSLKQFSVNGGASGIMISPPSNLGTQKHNDPETLDYIQKEQYLQRRQLIQLQREKKQELLNHIDKSAKAVSQIGAETKIEDNILPPSLVQAANDTLTPQMQTSHEVGVAMAASGSQYLLASNAAIAAYNSVTNKGQALVVNNNFNPTLRSAQRAVQKELSNLNSGTTSSMATHTGNASHLVHSRQVGQSHDTSIHPSDSIINSKRRFNILGHFNDPARGLPASSLNIKQSQKGRIAESLQPQQIMGGSIDLKHKQLGNGVCISGKQIGQPVQGLNPSSHMQMFQNQQLQLQNMMALGATSEQLMQHLLQHNLNQNQTPGGPITQRNEPDQINQSQSYNNSNFKITRKRDGARPHKIYDYMFIQMSNEQFKAEYEGKKILVQKSQSQLDQHQDNQKRFQMQSSPSKYNFQGNLDGLVKVKAYDNMVTDELPLMQCNLLPTQLDHIKLLICQQEDKNYPKLTPDAAARFEIEKQNQIKQYMEDIIIKLQQKERRFKVTVKKKFIDDALYNTTSIRVASVYVIVVNREKTYDPIMNKQFLQKHKKLMNEMKQNEESSEEEDNDYGPKSDIQKIRDAFRNNTNPNQIKKTPSYESDTNGITADANLNNNTASGKALTNLKQPLQSDKDDKNSLKNKIKSVVQPPPQAKPKPRQDDLTQYRYVTPVKEFPQKYKETKIKICQDVTVHDHYKRHPINIFTNQYNEFIRLVFKNQKQSGNQKFNTQYAMGLARALGMNLKKDAFSDNNMKSREHISMLKEKLIFCFWKKLYDENRDTGVSSDKNNSQAMKVINDSSENELDGGNSIDSTIASSNTPRSKSLGMNLKQENESQGDTGIALKTGSSKQQTNNGSSDGWVLPNSNVIYKYFIGKGNNSMMVRSLFKNRYWWVQGDEIDNKVLNFTWTQNKVQKIFENLACKYPNKKSGNKHSEFPLHATPQQTRSVKKKKLQNSETQKKDSGTTNAASIKHSEVKLYNKIEDNFHMNNKKALYLNMKNYYEAIDQDVFDNLPLTFHIKTGFDDPEFKRFEQFYKNIDEEIKNKKMKKREQVRTEKSIENNDQQQVVSPSSSPGKQQDENNNSQKNQECGDAQKDQKQKQDYYKTQQPQKNIWIIKPGENTNRGQGIQVAKELDEIKEIIADSTRSSKRTCILQKYIHNPLLINRRKFDIRTYALFTSWNGNLKAYIYEEGYLRTSCREYSIHNLNNKLVHLTNDAVQKQSQDYGKFEPGNKLSFNEFQTFLDKTYPDLHICFERDILPQTNKLTIDIFRAVHSKLDPKRRLHCMEVFGLDFMIDDEFRPYLIEVNTNPCLELSSPLLARLIPNMLENALKIGMDPVFLPPEGFSQKKAFIGDPCPENRFTLVYDEKIDGPVLDNIFKIKRDVIVEMDEEFSDDEDVHDDDAEDEQF